MSLSGIIHHSHSFTRLEIYHHIYFKYFYVINPELIKYFGHRKEGNSLGHIIQIQVLKVLQSIHGTRDQYFGNLNGVLKFTRQF